MIHAIIFDCFGVLYNDPSLDVIRPFVPEPTPEYYRLSRAFDLGEMTKEEFYAGLANITHQSTQDVAEHMEDTSGLNRELVERIRTHKPNYKIGMLSNISTAFLQQFLDNHNLRDLFDVIITSQEEGFMKPQPEIFNLTLGRLGVQPDEAIFIDDREDNIRGAEAVGITSILYKNNAQLNQELEAKLKS
ncbi:MAG TPA: HAD family phosphatase [Candidatus Saccharimonadia bacterium]